MTGDEFAQRAVVAIERRDGGVEHLAGIHGVPPDDQAMDGGEPADENPLGPPAALAEWLKGVDFAKIFGEPFGEVGCTAPRIPLSSST